MSATSLQEADNERHSPLERWSGLLGGGWIFLLLIALVAIFANFAAGAIRFELQFVDAHDQCGHPSRSLGRTNIRDHRRRDRPFRRDGPRLRLDRVRPNHAVAFRRRGRTYGATQGGWAVVLVGLAAALVSGAFWGAVNGVLVSAARIPPLIVTLGTFGMALGFAQILTNGVDIRAVPEILVDQIGSGTIAGVPVLVMIAAAVAVIGAIVLHLTRFGVHVFAVGSNKEAARRAGIRVGRKIVAIYVLSGALAGLAAMMSTARFATTTIGGHAMDNLSTISAVVLGGTSLFGGIGSIVGTVVGVFIPIVLLNGFVILGIPPFWQTVATGAVLILAVWIDQLKRSARERS